MRVGGRKLNLEDGKSWLSDYAREFIMSCFRVWPKPGIVSYFTWEYSLWVYKPLTSQQSRVLSILPPHLSPKRKLYEVLHCRLPLQASCSYSPDKAIRSIWSFCEIYQVYICIVASCNTITVNEGSEPAQNEGIKVSYSFTVSDHLIIESVPSKLLAFIKPRSNAAVNSQAIK